MQKLKISEIFYSLQGEGNRKGAPSIFIRVQGCAAKHACYAAGIRCDTEFESGFEISPEDLLKRIKVFPCDWIVWTGGEPAQMIDDEVVAFFKANHYYQAIETSGLFPVAKGLDFISISPKVAEHVIEKNFKDVRVSELRYVRHKGQAIPQPSLKVAYRYISPHFNGFDMDNENVKHCIQLCLDNPSWSLSIQEHKLINIL